MPKTLFADNAALMSPRTARYVKAMVREGFDYNEWLKNVRQQEAQAKQAATTIAHCDIVAARVDNPINTSGSRDARRSASLPLTTKILRTLALRAHKSQTPKTRLRRRLEKVHRARVEFQGSRRRDAVYEYLAAVFAIVTHYRVRRRIQRLLRHASAFANLPFERDADAFSVIIRCTSERHIDNKTISKWARALRYVAKCKAPKIPLNRFMKKMGGVNACAAAYAKNSGAQ